VEPSLWLLQRRFCITWFQFRLRPRALIRSWSRFAQGMAFPPWQAPLCEVTAPAARRVRKLASGSVSVHRDDACTVTDDEVSFRAMRRKREKER
jgi:hypothetical protein